MQEVDAKLASVEDQQVKRELQRIRELIKQLVPQATEQISYGMPALKVKGKYVIAYWAFKNHLSLFPGAEVVEQLKGKLGDHATSKGTVQFTLQDPLGDQLIRDIVQLRLDAILKP